MWIPIAVLLAFSPPDDEPVSPFANNHYPMHAEAIPDTIDGLSGSYGRTRLLRRSNDLDPHVVTLKGSHLFVTVSPGNYASWHVDLDEQTAAFDVVADANSGDRVVAITATGIAEFTPGTERHLYDTRILNETLTDALAMDAGSFSSATSDELAILGLDGLTVHLFDLTTETFGPAVTLGAAAKSMIPFDFDGDGDDDLATLADGRVEIVDASGALLLSDVVPYVDLHGLRTRSTFWDDQLTVFGKYGDFQYFRTYMKDRAGQLHAEVWRELGYTDFRAPVALDLDQDGTEDIHGLSGWDQKLIHMLNAIPATNDPAAALDVAFPVDPLFMFSTNYSDTPAAPSGFNRCQPVLIDLDHDSDVDLFLHDQENSANPLVRGPIAEDHVLRVGPMNSHIYETTTGHSLDLELVRPIEIPTAATDIEVVLRLAGGAGQAATADPIVQRFAVPSLWFTSDVDESLTTFTIPFQQLFDPEVHVIYFEMRLLELSAQGNALQTWTPVHAVAAASLAVTSDLHDIWGEDAPAVELRYHYITPPPTDTLGIGCVVCLPLVIPPPAPAGGG